MENKPRKLWFKAKMYGWGWYPSTWEGWLVLLVFMVMFTAGVSYFEVRLPHYRTWHDAIWYFIYVTLITSILLYVCWKKGEKPSWRWGKKKDDKE